MTLHFGQHLILIFKIFYSREFKWYNFVVICFFLMAETENLFMYHPATSESFFVNFFLIVFKF